MKGATTYCDIRKSCTGTRAGHFAPVLVLRLPWSDTEHRQRLPRRCCWSCRESVTVLDLVPDSAWATIAAGYYARGKNPPERSRATLEFVEAD